MVALANGDVITIGGRNIDADITDSRWIFRGISMPKSGPLLRYTPSKSKWAGFLLSEAQSYGAAAVNIESEQLYFSNAAVEKTPNTVTPKPAVLEVDLKTYHSTNRASRSERQIVGGFSQFLPMGRKGVLVNFGGIDMGDKGKTQGMEKIEIYDVDTETWITQTAEGAKDSGVPSGRTDGCSVMAKAEDGSSWNIYMYGGLERDSGKALNDVWVLSIPSFTWIKLATNMASRKFPPPDLHKPSKLTCYKPQTQLTPPAPSPGDTSSPLLALRRLHQKLVARATRSSTHLTSLRSHGRRPTFPTPNMRLRPQSRA